MAEPIAEYNSSETKLSPQRALSPAQEALVRRITTFCENHERDSHAVLVIHGDAGTGKSLVLNKAFAVLQQAARAKGATGPLAGTRNVFLVNHPEMIKLYRNIAESSPTLRKKDYERPTTFINHMDKAGQRADIVFVDEAHLLLSRADRYNRFTQDNQLREIIRLSRVVVLVFDPRQVLKFKSYWDDQRLAQILGPVPHEVCTLTEQFRVRARPDMLEWISAFCHARLLPLPARQDFDFRIYDDAAAMYRDIRARNATYGLSRMLSTYDYPYTLDGHDHFIEEGAFRLRWDRARPEQRLPWAERADTIDEVGSVYTVQGFDLNYVGLILGPSVTYDPACGRIVIDPDRYEDGAAFAGRGHLHDPDTVKQQIMLNAINVLMTRGTRGLYLYASNPALRAALGVRQPEDATHTATHA
ncbi:DUF2075 domain-containing protein [Acetobacter sp. TBRC 12305]|uniref:DUF2075 domain-containing protein n=1 Tax=Acetobacter garciniae TaxID=2817435 RepID=A0A939KRU2_9PROT|nr:DUF2075 domain-containing protein [Acetobacter garciniae]MBO1326156.1 DUF2075 domain-containing protein [Acetobacter garciniae]MBX0345100.1 DUF2075 domain-containing protein [Acetobacter garciniae]